MSARFLPLLLLPALAFAQVSQLSNAPINRDGSLSPTAIHLPDLGQIFVGSSNTRLLRYNNVTSQVEYYEGGSAQFAFSDGGTFSSINPSVSPGFGSSFTQSRGVFAGANSQSGLAGMADNRAGGKNFPTGVTGYAKLESTATGGSAFGLFGRCDLHATGSGCVGFETNVFNEYGPPTTTFPPNLGFGSPNVNAIGENLVPYGSYDSYIGLLLTHGENDSGTGATRWVAGIYSAPHSVTQHDIFLDADSSPNTGVTRINIRDNGGLPIAIQTLGATVDAPVFQVTDRDGTPRAVLNQNGSVTLGKNSSVRGESGCIALSSTTFDDLPGVGQGIRCVLHAKSKGTASVRLTSDGSNEANSSNSIPIIERTGASLTIIVLARDVVNGSLANFSCPNILARHHDGKGIAIVGNATCKLINGDTTISGSNISITADIVNQSIAVIATGVEGAQINWTAIVTGAEG